MGWRENKSLARCQVAAVQIDQAGPTILLVGDGGGVADAAAVVVHFEEEEAGEFFDVVAVGEAGTVVPETLDDWG